MHHPSMSRHADRAAMLKPSRRPTHLLASLTGLLWLSVIAPGSHALAEGRAITAYDLATLVDVGGLAVSPDGRWLAFQTRQADPVGNAYTQAWHVVPTSGGNVRRVADGGHPILLEVLGRVAGAIMIPAAVWSPDSKWIAFVRREGGRTQVWRARVDGRGSEQLTHGEADVRALAYSRDGRRLLFETELSETQIASALALEGRAGFLYDQRFFPTYSTMPVMPSDMAFRAATPRSTAGEEAQRRVLVYELAGGRTRLATDREAEEFKSLTSVQHPESRAFREISSASPEGAIAWTEARDPEQQGGIPPLTIVAHTKGARDPVTCNAEACTGRRIKGLWWRYESEIIFARGEGVRDQDTALYAWRIGEDAAHLVLRTPHLFTSPFEWKCAVALDRLICFYEEPARPRRLVAIDLNRGIVNTLYDPNPDFATFDLGPEPRRLEFRSPSGVENYGYLVLPPRRREGERLSLIIVTYRCSGFLRGGTGDEYPIFPFAAQGHAVLCFNTPDTDFARLAQMDWDAYNAWARGEGDPEKRRVQEGLTTAVAYLDRMGVIDPTRVGITGLSFGAETVMYALFNMPNLGAAIASGTEIGPASTFLYGPAGRGPLRQFGLTSPDSKRWDTLSITRNANLVEAPLLINVADREMLSALHPVTALQDAGRVVEMYIYPNEYHNKWQPVHRHAIYERNIEWMNFWLLGEEGQNPSKIAQYRRWREMRSTRLPGSAR